jgi:hypothetical protein
MNRLFPSANLKNSAPTSLAGIGSSSLLGVFNCSYCQGPHAQWARFTLCFASGAVNDKLSFCTPECAAGYNVYRCPQEGSAERFLFLQHAVGREVALPPHYKLLVGVDRMHWLQECRKHLLPVYGTIIGREMRVLN